MVFWLCIIYLYIYNKKGKQNALKDNHNKYVKIWFEIFIGNVVVCTEMYQSRGLAEIQYR